MPEVGFPHNERPVSGYDNPPSTSKFHTNLRLISLPSFSWVIVAQIRSWSFLAIWDATKETKQVVHIASLTLHRWSAHRDGWVKGVKRVSVAVGPGHHHCDR
ncbi:hypothetical protein M758_UG226600 [Ceratodon purpureus]|nr:hypothetical protein M758_UG226600 [Ceratodon purpureus]